VKEEEKGNKLIGLFEFPEKGRSKTEIQYNY
jgi:hypothetical protein